MGTDIESRINEAEVCRSMGLYGDSLAIYENILTLVLPEDSQTQDKIQKRINLLNKEMSESEAKKPKEVSAKDISMFKKTFSGQGDVTEILDSASAFQEMGLHGEAVGEYVKLLKEDYPKEKIIPNLAGSILKLPSPAKAVNEFDKIIEGQKLNKKDVAFTKFLLGTEFERREYRDQAHDLFKDAAELDPSYPEII
jgi:tetratricopeptide (TPR) repeat protein